MTQNEENIESALRGMFGGLLQRASDERRASEPYQHLFASFKDGGIAKAVFEAERQMKSVALNLSQLLSEQTGKRVGNELYSVILALPLAMSLVRKDIEQNEGSMCCADKTRLMLKTYFYETLGLDIEAVPFQPRTEPSAATTTSAGGGEG